MGRVWFMVSTPCRFYALPSPPADFIAACLQCVAVTARPENEGRKVGRVLGEELGIVSGRGMV